MATYKTRKKRLNSLKKGYARMIPLELHEQLDEAQIRIINDKFAKDRFFTAEKLQEVLWEVADLTFNPDEFSLLFRRMNRDCNGRVTWDEFISYLIVGFQQKEVSLEYQSLLPPIPLAPKMIRSHHRHPITKILFYPTVRPDRTMSEKAGSIVTCSRDGTVNFWSINMQLGKSEQSTCPDLKIQSSWVMDMVVLADVSILCTSSTERDLRFYDTSAKKFELRVIFTCFDYPVCTMFYSFNINAEVPSRLILGDTVGNIKIIFINSVARGPFKSKPGDPLLYVRFEKVLKNLVPGFRVVDFNRQHTDFVRQLSYYEALHSIVSCSQCSKAALLMIDDTKTKDNYVFRISTGAWCFALDESVHIIATGGPDCLIRIWSSFLPARPTAILYGHHTGVVKMILQNSAQLLYSLSKDKGIKVWDVFKQTCLQSFFGLPDKIGERCPLTAWYYHYKRQWIIGGAMIALLPLSPVHNAKHTDGTTHSEIVSVVLYNKLYKLVVTCCLASYILLWNPWDGRRMLVVKDAHVTVVYGVKVPLQITAATFCPGDIRLITGATDGSMKVWNFRNGVCLRNLKLDTGDEIKSIIWVKSRIFACGWNRLVVEFADDLNEGSPVSNIGKNWEQLHEEDISFSTVRIPHTLATGSYHGELIFWRLETGQPYKKFFVYNPTLSIKINYKARPKEKTFYDETNLRQQYLKKKNKLSIESNKSKRAGSIHTKITETVDEQHFRPVAIHCMLFLCNREMEPEIGTLLVALGNGFVQVWSHHVAGGFIMAFTAVHKVGDYIISMTTDLKNEYLFTGSCLGYMKTWLLVDYCLGPNTPKASLPMYRVKFPFMWGERFWGRAQNMVRTQPNPTLLNSMKGHLKPVTCLVYIDQAEILLSGSGDFSVRMWTLGGRFLQTLGTFKQWKPLQCKPVEESFKFTIPADMTRTLSSTTLRVLLGGTIPKKLTIKQLEAQKKKKKMYIDTQKVYGRSLDDPILGNFYDIPERTTKSGDIELDTNFPYIPVYQHLIMPQHESIPSTSVEMRPNYATSASISKSEN